MGNKKRKHQPSKVEEPASKVRPIFTHLLALVLGSGAVWQFAHWNLERDNQANDIRKQIVLAQDKLLDIVTKSYEAQWIINEPGQQQRQADLSLRYKVVHAEYDEWESKLAALEGRPPRKIEFDITPPGRPTGMRVK